MEIFTISMFRRSSLYDSTKWKNAILSIAVLLIFNGCNFSDSNIISKSWCFVYANAPIVKNMADSAKIFNFPAPYKQVFAGSKLILRKDKSFDCVLFDNYRHGNWEFDEESRQLFLTPCNQKEIIRLAIDSLSNDLIQFRIDSLNFTKWKAFRNPENSTNGWFTHNRQVIFRLAKDDDLYSNPEKDPYNLLSNRWRIKPIRSETPEEIKQRVIQHLRFFKLLFDDAYDNDKDYVLYNWFVSPVLPANNGIELKSYSKIKKGWEGCFYDSVQAIEGFHFLRYAFSKHLEFPENLDNKFKRGSNMIDQILKNIE